MPEDQGTPEIPAPAVETADVTPPVEPASPTPEPAPDATTVTPPPPAATPAAGPKVASVSDYERRLAEVTSGAAAEEPEPGTPAQEPAPAPAAVTPPAEPTVAPTPPAEPPKEFRPRLNSLPAEEREAIALRKDLKDKGEDVPLAECLARVQAKYAGPPAAAAPAPDATPARTAEAVQQEIADTEQARRDAIRKLDPDAQFEAEDKIRQLQAESAEIASRQQQAHVSEQSAFEQAVSQSHELTAQVYPAYADPAHAIHAVADRIYATMEKTGNPIVTQSDCPFKVYQMAANELGIPPVDPGTQPPPAAVAPAPVAPKSPALATPKPQPVQRTAVVRPPSAVAPAPASARTTPPGPPKPAFGKIRSTADYEATVAQLAG